MNECRYFCCKTLPIRKTVTRIDASSFWFADNGTWNHYFGRFIGNIKQNQSIGFFLIPKKQTRHFGIRNQGFIEWLVYDKLLSSFLLSLLQKGWNCPIER